jgi:N,N'-diacetylchitobiose transport system permease protein
VITAIVVWGAIPFVAITLYAGLTQVPGELVEAAQIDGAGRWQVFRDVTFPLLKPIFVIVTSLSIIWDFQIFNQIWLVRDGEPEEDYWLMSVYSFVEAFRLGEYGFGAAIAVVMVGVMFLATFVYLRQMIRIGETR